MNEVIIDGCNVAECEFFQSEYLEDNSVFCEFCTLFYNACLNNPDCYFKQLQRAKAEKQEKVLKMAEAEVEIEKLQAENEKLKAMAGVYSVKLMEKYKKALEDIRELLRGHQIADEARIEIILDLINKALND